MCCRYYFDEKTIADLEKIVRNVDWKINGTASGYGAIHPGDHAPVLVSSGQAFELRHMKWGFTHPANNSLIINATSEHAAQKPMFMPHLSSRRCIIPAKCFYEWDKDHQKSTFSLPESEPLFMAGLYNLYDNEDHFVILTTAANHSMEPVHDRMPLILSAEDMTELWLNSEEEAMTCLKKKSPELCRETEYEQLSLFDF